MIERKYIDFVFYELNNADISYLLIKNMNNELPCNLENGKDIELRVYFMNLVKSIYKLQDGFLRLQKGNLSFS